MGTDDSGRPTPGRPRQDSAHPNDPRGLASVAAPQERGTSPGILYRALTMDTPADPFEGGGLRIEQDAGLLVRDGLIVERGPYADLRSRHREATTVDLSQGLLLPGFVDTHVHFPQVRVIGGLGMPLLEWLDRCALPEEARMGDVSIAREVAREFLTGLAGAGTTSALVFGSHFPSAVDAFCEEATGSGLRIVTGLVVADRILRADLLTTPERAHAESVALARRWHGRGRLRYAVTPRFALSATAELLASCAQTLADVPGALFTSHVNENPLEIEEVRLLSGLPCYTDAYDRPGLLRARSVLAHNVHPTDAELEQLAGRRVAIAHCPTSNSALGSGLFPMRRHLDAGVPLALGSDVGAGTGFCLLKEGLQAYFVQRLHPDGVPLTPAHLLYLATAAGARALGQESEVGHLSEGMRFDAVWVRPRPGDPMDVGLRHAQDASDALATVFALGTPADIAGVWVDGERLA